MTPGLAAVLDRTKVSDRKATALLYTVGESLGQNMSEFSVNRSSIVVVALRKGKQQLQK